MLCVCVRVRKSIVSQMRDNMSDENGTHDHCASQPCSVTAPASDVMVVSGKPFAIQGLPGEVLNSSSSSSGLKAPSRSCSTRRQAGEI